MSETPHSCANATGRNVQLHEVASVTGYSLLPYIEGMLIPSTHSLEVAAGPIEGGTCCKCKVTETQGH